MYLSVDLMHWRRRFDPRALAAQAACITFLRWFLSSANLVASISVISEQEQSSDIVDPLRKEKWKGKDESTCTLGVKLRYCVNAQMRLNVTHSRQL